MRMFVVAFLLVAPIFGQDAKIMILDKADSDHLSSAYQNYLQAKKQWEQVKTYVADKYTVDAVKPEIVKDGKAAKNYKEGWDKVQYSADFRALVPDQSQYAFHYPYCTSNLLYNGGSFGTTLANATGTTAFLGTTDTTVPFTGTFDGSSFDDVSVNGGLVVIDKSNGHPKRADGFR